MDRSKTEEKGRQHEPGHHVEKTPDSLAGGPIPKPLIELAELLAAALARRWVEQRRREDDICSQKKDIAK